MKRAARLAALAATAATLIAASGGLWLALSAPPAEPLPLAADLVAATSAQGRQLLASSSSKTDLGQLEPVLVPQTRRAFCGPATSAAVINAALRPQPQVTQSSLFNAAVSTIKSELAVSFSGLTLDELAAVLRAHGLQVRVVHADRSDATAFRQAAQAALSEPRTFLVANYDRKALGQEGAGHISPLGAFEPASDRLLVLDVASHRYPPTWVPLAKLWSAMNTVDTDSGRSRGYLLVSAPS